jgi:hypothetical protein
MRGVPSMGALLATAVVEEGEEEEGEGGEAAQPSTPPGAFFGMETGKDVWKVGWWVAV